MITLVNMLNNLDGIPFKEFYYDTRTCLLCAICKKDGEEVICVVDGGEWKTYQDGEESMWIDEIEQKSTLVEVLKAHHTSFEDVIVICDTDDRTYLGVLGLGFISTNGYEIYISEIE